MLLAMLSRLRPDPRERRLHIGGETRRDGWEVLNAVAGPHVDHVMNACDLGCFKDGTFVEVYASHVLEHLDFVGEMQSALREWHRVLVPKGRLYVSVPDLTTLAQLFLTEGLTHNERFGIVKMVFGAHSNAHDYHKVGFNLPILAYFLGEAGFVDVERVPDLSHFNDTSRAVFKGVPISLNVTARRAG